MRKSRLVFRLMVACVLTWFLALSALFYLEKHAGNSNQRLEQVFLYPEKQGHTESRGLGGGAHDNRGGELRGKLAEEQSVEEFYKVEHVLQKPVYNGTDNEDQQFTTKNSRDSLGDSKGQTEEMNDWDRSKWPPKASANDKGYAGLGFVLNVSSLNAGDKKLYDQGYQEAKVNKFASDQIPLRREINLNMSECSGLNYSAAGLPQAGVVLIFHNEVYSVLLRTVYSLLDADTNNLITEVILVDDASDKTELGQALDDYVNETFAGKVKIVRMPERKGLIVARMIGFDHVTGDVAVFLDSHCEVSKGWLEPLLQRIQDDPSVLAVPATDSINYDTFAYNFVSNTEQSLGGLDLDLYFNWMPQRPRPAAGGGRLSEPLASPTHLGCCFAVAKDTFNRLGRYDPGLRIWGCENIELSFKAWMCGGRVEILPCSHVGHMFRPAFPYSWGSEANTVLTKNCLRVAEVWMDDYKYYFHERIALQERNVDMGDVSDRKDLRSKLGCHSFEWYLKEVFPELYIPRDAKASGRISSVASPTVCIEVDTHSWSNEEAHATGCSADSKEHFVLTHGGQIRRDQGCWAMDPDLKVRAKDCRDTPIGQWSYTEADTIVFEPQKRCLVLSEDNTHLEMKMCNVEDPRQRWTWQRKSLFQVKT